MVNIMIDSGCDLREELIANEFCNVECIPLNLHIEDKVYVDDKSLNVDDFLNHMESSPVAVKTAAPSPQLFVDMFKKGENFFVVTLSAKLSGTYDSAMLAKRTYLEEYGKKFIHIFDSLTASIGEGLVALKIAEAAKNGLNNLEIVEHVSNFIKGMHTYFILDKFDNLVKTGRINPYIAKLASFLNIKPVCGSENGEIKLFDKARGYNKAVKRMIELMKENTPDLEGRIVGITHCKCYEKALALKDEFIKTLKVKDVIIQEARGLITVYANRGGLVVAL